MEVVVCCCPFLVEPWQRIVVEFKFYPWSSPQIIGPLKGSRFGREMGPLILGKSRLVKYYTLPETNSKSTCQWMVWNTRPFPFGAGKRPIFRGGMAVSFREGNSFGIHKNKS